MSAPSTTPTGKSLIEHRSIDWVPESERHGKLWHQAPLWFLGNFQYFSIPIGFIGPSMGLSLGWTILASVLGIAVGTVFMAFHASQGPVMGLPQMIQSRAQFGYRGVVVPLIATLLTYVGFNIADTVLLGEGISGSFGLNPVLVSLLAGAIAVILAVFGHDWVHKAFRVLLYFSLPVMTVVTLGVIFGGAGGSGTVDKGGFTVVAFMAQFAASAAYNITYAPYVSDYSRYLPSKTSARGVISAVFFGASTAAIWLISLGAWLAIYLGAQDGLVGLQQAGNNVFAHLGDVAAILSALALVATMGMNAYGGMLTVMTTVDSFRPVRPGPRAKALTVLALAVVWFVAASAISSNGVATVFAALTLMLYALVPWTATNLIDFFFVRRGHYAISELFKLNGVYGVWNRRGLLAFFIGLVAEVPFMVVTGVYTGPVADALGGVDIAWLVGLAVSSASYLLLSRGIDVAAEKEAMAHDGAALAAMLEENG
ncbi:MULTISPECIES: cytosine permease [Arthrobacter]|uniref:Cytosine permease n=2 Tax=Arthrobacter TaxID=1663 RepID=A0ABU9KPX6_9MICC|nr:cytosine permease [Arthrobacter sp. YJM1]MDP5227563.1 cytosine permease [Arthrobacter sp. YJM1]